MEFMEHFQVFHQFVDLLERIGPDLFGADVFQDYLGLLRVDPKVSLLGDQFLIFYFKSLPIVVKDTSSRRSCGPSSLSTCLMSWILFKICTNIVNRAIRIQDMRH